MCFGIMKIGCMCVYCYFCREIEGEELISDLDNGCLCDDLGMSYYLWW